MADALDVQPARRDVGGDEDVDLPGLEPVKLAQPFGLFHVAMDLADGKAIALQAGRQFAHRRLAVGKDDRGVEIVGAQQAAQRLALVAAGGFDQLLFDQRIGAGRACDLDRFGVGEKLVRQLLDRRRHGGRKQQCLARLGQFGTDFLDIGDKPHVEHPVRLVDHQQLAARQQDVAALEQVHQPAGRRDQHVDAFFQRLLLVAHRYAADQQRHRKLVIFAVFVEVFGDLRGQFARRLEDQRARHPRAAAALCQHVDHRQNEACRLARSGLRDADQVAPHQHRRNGLALDRRRIVVTGIADGFQKLVGQAEIGKAHRIPEDRMAAVSA